MPRTVLGGGISAYLLTAEASPSKIASMSNRVFAVAIASFMAAMMPLCSPVEAQQATASSSQAKVEQLVKLLDDPDVRTLLAERSGRHSAETLTAMSASAFTFWVNETQRHVRDIAQSIPLVPDELNKAAMTASAQSDSRGPGGILLLLALLMAIGLCAEIGFMLAVRNLHGHRTASIGPKPDSGLHVFGRTLFSRLAPVVVFGIFSVGGLLLFPWPPLVNVLAVPALSTLVAHRIAVRLSTAILVPNSGRTTPGQTRLVVMDDETARFWSRRVTVFTAIFLAGWSADGIMTALDVIGPVKALGLDLIYATLLATGLQTVWRRPRAVEHKHRHGVVDWMLAFWLCTLWATSMVGLHLMTLAFLYAVVLPGALKAVTVIIRAAIEIPNHPAPGLSPVVRVLVERGVRAAIIALAVLWPVCILRTDTAAMAQDAATGEIIRGIFSGAIVLLSADIVWEIAKALINHRLAVSRAESESEGDLAHSDRLLTLLPILRNFLAVLIAAVATMMVLAAVGIQVGPLIAGAGIFGVAIGFGSQTLVRDVISGIFYMTDDAFRVGEYIQSGTYKGTVESFSLRSVRLRHHRGPVFTVPFGSLGAVENMSRDWAIDKFFISVSYQTDVAIVKKLVKDIGAQLVEDPELGHLIIESVKMKGVEQFGDYGIRLSFGMTTKPGQQSMLRRRVLIMIREAFAANGIEFASPIVQVAKEEKAADTQPPSPVNPYVVQRKSADEPI